MPANGAWRAVAVVCRAEGRADQRPIKFQFGEDWLQVDEVLAAWLDRGPEAASPVFRMFEVTCSGRVFRLRVEEGGWLWQCRTIQVT